MGLRAPNPRKLSPARPGPRCRAKPPWTHRAEREVSKEVLLALKGLVASYGGGLVVGKSLRSSKSCRGYCLGLGMGKKCSI